MRNVPGRLYFIILLLFISWGSHSQKITVEGAFVEDSLKIGENIHYWLRAVYPAEVELILPDTTYDFSPFEFSAKQYFPSQVQNGAIKDSAVYTLQSYEIEALQFLSLPAFVIGQKGDSTEIKPDQDTIQFHSLVPVATDTTQLKENLAYQAVQTEFNYPVLWIMISALIVILLVVYFVFGDKIRRNFKLRKLKKEYIKFSDQLTEQIRELKKQPDQKLAEHTLAEWKLFLEKLENKPFSKLTTKEIMSMEYTNELNGTLKNIDRCVYGGMVSQELYKDFQSIEDFTQHRYSVVTDQIKNDKK